MSPPRPQPARVLIRLYRRVYSTHAADAAIGDILEDLEERRAAGRSPRWPRLWINLQILWSLTATVAGSTPSAIRSAGRIVRDAARMLRRSPAHTLFILGILAVGISAATVTFSVVDAVVLKPLPFDHSEQLVVVRGRLSDRFTALSPEEFKAIRDGVAGFEGVGTVSIGGHTAVTTGGAPEYLDVALATAAYLDVLRLKPALGRIWTPDEEADRDTQVAVLGFEFWQSHFGGARDVRGRTIQVYERSYQIIGVLSAGPSRPDGQLIAAWVPSQALTLQPNAGPVRRTVSLLGRLRPGVSVSHVAAEIATALAPLAAAHQADYKDWRPDVQRWNTLLVGGSLNWLLLILTAVMLVVLIACVNVANVMLTRSAERAHDHAIRASLGASRRHLALSTLAESFLLSGAACALALLFASWAIGAIKGVLPPLFRGNTIALDQRVFLASILAVVVTTLLSGTVPAWQASRTNVVDLLKDSGTSTTAKRRWRGLFLVAEVACIGVLLVVATLFIVSFVRVTTTGLGFDRSNLLGVSTVTDYQGTVDDVKHRLELIPGVVGVAAVQGMPPLVGPAYGGAYPDTPLRRVDGASSVTVDVYGVSANYFGVTGMPFRRGSGWAADAVGSQSIVIDELTARSLFADEASIGRQVQAKDLKDRIFTIVGIVPQAFQRGPETNRPTAYYALKPNYKPSWIGFVLRTSRSPELMVHSVESVLAQISKPDGSGGQGVHTIDAAFRRLTATRRFNATLMTAFAIFALFIGAAGIYAVMASVVAQQTREIGVRIALGATARDIRHGVLSLAGRHVVGGLIIALPVGWWISRGFASLFFQVTPADASVYLIVTALLGVIGTLAALVPARRAARVDPIVSLRAS